MPVPRPVRRNSTSTYILATILVVCFLYFFFGDDDTLAAIPNVASRQLLKSKDAASNILSPPSLPFRKPAKLDPGEIPPPPPVVHYKMNNVTTSGDPIGNRETVLILTPLARFYQGYWENLEKMSYPHELISLGFIIPKGKEGNAATTLLQERIAITQAPTNKNRFASITILRQDHEPSDLYSQAESERHALHVQKERRSRMSRARNSILFTTLGPTTSWVLWLDSDIVETPPSLIQDLASHNKPIIVPNCFQRYYDEEKGAMATRPYDFNSWQDSATAQILAEKMGPDEILLEGYAEMATYRSLMAYMAGTHCLSLWIATQANHISRPQGRIRPCRQTRRRRRHSTARQSRRAPRRRHVPAFPLLPSDRDGRLRQNGESLRLGEFRAAELLCPSFPFILKSTVFANG